MHQEKETESKTIPPYVPYKTFTNFIDGLRVAEITTRIDRSIMGSFSGAIQSQLINALKYLKLIDANGAPSEKLTRLVKSEGPEQKKIFKDILHNAYSFVFRDGFDLARTTPRLLDEQFDNVGATGDTVRKCVAFFIAAAKDAGIPLSPHIKTKQRGPRPNSPRIRKPAGEASPKGGSEVGEGVPGGEPLGWAQLLLAKFPSFEPTWAPEVQAKWFESFEKLMKAVAEKKE